MATDLYCRVAEKVYGPMSPQDVKLMAQRGLLKATDLVRKTENGRWILARSVKGLTFVGGTEAVINPVEALPVLEGNLKPGAKAPRTGIYTCIWCGPNGLGARTARSALEILGSSIGKELRNSPPSCADKSPPFMLFKEGDCFPSCPNCKGDRSGSDPTGWSFCKAPPATSPSRLSDELIKCVPANVARELVVFPLSREEGVLRLLATSPDPDQKQRLEFIFNCTVELQSASQEQILEHIDQFYKAQ